MSTYNPYFQATVLLIFCIFFVSQISGQVHPLPSGECHMVTDLAYSKSITSYKSLKNNTSVQNDTIGIYFEVDHALYNLFNSSVFESISYLNQLFSNVQEIYAQEGITIKISGYRIWDTPDPYENRSARHALLSFAEILGDQYNGHLAHLLSGNSNKNGGLAYLSGFCDRSKSFGYSNVYGEVGSLDQYSWDIHVVAHEIGHNLGAPHTNDCLWGPNNDTALDGCGQTNVSCSLASIPSTGGTIMSSCHTNPVGVNLSAGLGTEPAALIRSVIAACYPSEGGSCAHPMNISHEGNYTISSINSGDGALQSGADHSKWYLYNAQGDGFVSIGSCDQGIDTRLYIYQGECGNLTVEYDSDDNCHSGQGFLFASYIDSIEVQYGDSLWIEWDDRWSSEGFDWNLSFYPLQSATCYNGILDEGEDQIDCGGNCSPCNNPCGNLESLQMDMDQDGTYYSDTSLMMNSILAANTHLSISSAEEVIFEAGSTISEGSLLEVFIENCSSYQSRMASN